MTSYIIIPNKSHTAWLVKEKRYGSTVAKAETQAEARKKLAEIKEADKEKANAKAEAKKTAKANAENLVIGYVNELGRTASGKPYTLIGNCGLEKRSRYCYTLTIEGNCIFTSGTLEAAAEYIAKN